MLKVKRFAFLILVLISTSVLYQFRPVDVQAKKLKKQLTNKKTWLIHVSEGASFADSVRGIHEAFYLAAQNSKKVADSFGIPESQRFIYFGHSLGTIQYRHFGGLEPSKKLLDSFAQAVKNGSPNRCEIAGQYVKSQDDLLVHHPHIQDAFFNPFSPKGRDLRDLDFDGKNDLSGTSSQKDLDQGIAKILSLAQPGDHLIFNYAGNGLRDNSAHVWRLAMSDGELTTTSLGDLLKKFQEKNITVQLNVMACYSGGFTQLSRVGKIGMSCTTTANSDDKLYYGTIPPLYLSFFDNTFMRELAKRGSQLESYACALGIEPLNFPESGLDAVVSNWEKNKNIDTSQPLRAPLAKFEAADDYKPSLEADRLSWLGAYREMMIQTLKSCHELPEVKVESSMNQCFDTPAFAKGYSKPMKSDDGLRQWIRDPWARLEKGDSLDRINRHLRFIESADADSFAEFKAVFCCLSFNPKTGLSPEICKGNQK